MLFSLVIASVIGSVILAFLILARSHHAALHRWLSVFIVASAAWVLFVNLQDPSLAATGNAWFARLAFVSATVMTYAMWRFSASLTGHQLSVPRRRAALGAVTVNVLLCATPFVIGGASLDARHAVALDRGLLYPLVIFVILLFAVEGVRLLVWRFIHSTNKVERQRLMITTIGLVQGIIVGVTTNVVLPNALGTMEPARYAFIPIIIWSVLLTYAIVRHRFLDIRAVVAKSVAYALVLLTLVFLYAVLVFTLSQAFFRDNGLGWLDQFIYAGPAIFLALTFQPLKQLFDALTDKVFFRDTYTPQELLDKISGDIASSATPRQLMKAVSHHMRHGMKVGGVAIYWYGTDRFYGSAHEIPRALPVGAIDAYVREARQEWIDVDDLYVTNQSLYEEVSAQGIGFMVRLRTAKKPVGYLCLGVKQNASPFTARDRQMLQVIAGELAVAMQNALRLEEIKGFNETLREKVEEATRELRRSNRRLHELDRTKDEFISMASHQLRTPLTTIKGYLSMVLEGDVGKVQPMQRKLLGEAFDSSQRMSYLITDFLNVSRLQTGKFELESKPTNLTEVLSQEIDQLQSIATSHQMKIAFTPEEVAEVELDEGKIRQVMMNFIDNAVYYSPSGSTITVSLKQRTDVIEFKVVDQGIGVPEGEKAGLFTKFYRASNARKQRPDGTGIGLFMAKKVIVAHGGEIVFKSKVGKGSTFGFRLPLSKHQS